MVEQINKKKDYKIFAIVIILILIVSGIFIIRHFTNKSSPKQTLTSCLEGRLYPNSYYSTCEGIRQRNFSFCLSTNSSCSDWVFFSRAVDYNNVSICNSIEWNNLKVLCLVVIKQDSSLCEQFKISNEREMCILFAKEGKDKSKINELSGAIESTLGEKSTALFYKAVLLKDAMNCKELQEISCYTSYYHVIAKLKKDVSYCDKIPDRGEIEYCKLQFT